MARPEYILIAGVNGSGKSTFYDAIFPNYPIVNSDVILKELGGNWKIKSCQFATMNEAFRRIYFNFENKKYVNLAMSIF